MLGILLVDGDDGPLVFRRIAYRLDRRSSDFLVSFMASEAQRVTKRRKLDRYLKQGSERKWGEDLDMPHPLAAETEKLSTVR